jgi:hypothetical protein
VDAFLKSLNRLREVIEHQEIFVRDATESGDKQVIGTAAADSAQALFNPLANGFKNLAQALRGR